jgi:hypothetical protein
MASKLVRAHNIPNTDLGTFYFSNVANIKSVTEDENGIRSHSKKLKAAQNLSH